MPSGSKRKPKPDVIGMGKKKDVEGLIEALGYRERSDVRSLAAMHLGNFGGEQAVKPLIRALKDEFSEVRRNAASSLGSIGDLRAMKPLIQALKKDKHKDVRRAAARALGQLGDPRAVKALISALKDDSGEVRATVVATLGDRCDPGLVDLFIGKLNNDEEVLVRSLSAGALGKIGDRRAVEPLMNALRDEHWIVRRNAVEALGRIGDERLVELFLGALKDDNENIRAAAAEALGATGDPGVVDPLVGALRDEDGIVRRAAARALGQIGDPRPIDVLIEMLHKGEKDDRLVAAESLAGIGGEQVVEALTDTLEDTSADMRKAAAQSLEKLNWEPPKNELGAVYQIALGQWDLCIPIGEPAVVPLVQRLEGGDEEVRRHAIQTLARIGTSSTAEPLIAALLHRNMKISKEAERALVEVGVPAVEPLVNAILADRLKKGYMDMSGTAGRILTGIGSPAVESLVDLLQNGSWKARAIAARALNEIGWSSEDQTINTIYYIANKEWAACARMSTPAVEVLLDAFKHGDEDMRASVASTLGKLRDPGVVDVLIDALEDESEDVRLFSAQALGEIGSTQAMDSLIARMQDHEWSVRRTAVHALGRLGDKGAENSLKEALQDGDWEVREAAAAALDMIGVKISRAWAKVDAKKLKICAKCGRTEQRILNDFELARRRGVVVIGNGDVLYYCANCDQSYCGQCQVDLYVAVGCPVCRNRLQPASKIMAYQRKG